MYLFPEFDMPILSLFEAAPAAMLPGEIDAASSPLYARRSLTP